MSRRRYIMALAAAASMAAAAASAQETIRIGAVQSMTGPFTSGTPKDIKRLLINVRPPFGSVPL
jgi:ABC-type sugar transport system substrate-binding protein